MVENTRKQFRDHDIGKVILEWSIVDFDLDKILRQLKRKIQLATDPELTSVEHLERNGFFGLAVLFGSLCMQELALEYIDAQDFQRFSRSEDKRLGLYARLYGIPLLTDFYYNPTDKFAEPDTVTLFQLKAPFQFPAAGLTL